MEPEEGPEAQWLRLSEVSNAADYLYRAVRFIRETPDDVSAWKWVIISLHGSLYGFAVSASSGTDYTSILTKKGKLLGFWDVLKMCCNPNHMKMLIHSQHLVLTPEQEESIKVLTNTFRNRFLHFTPTSWSIEIHGFPKMAIDVLEVIHFLARKTNTYIILSEDEEMRIDTVISETIDFIKTTDLYKSFLKARSAYEKVHST